MVSALLQTTPYRSNSWQHQQRQSSARRATFQLAASRSTTQINSPPSASLRHPGELCSERHPEVRIRRFERRFVRVSRRSARVSGANRLRIHSQVWHEQCSWPHANHICNWLATVPFSGFLETLCNRCALLLGTRIIYDRKFLLQLRNSPLSKTPPSNLPVIPGVTCVTSSSRSPPKQPTISELPERMELQPCERRAGQLPEDQQFHMDV